MASRTRQALNRMRTLARRREEYVGQWLPEPLLTSPDVAADVELATEQQEVVDRFLAAIRGGDLQGLLDVLAPDVLVVADGGGVVAAARRPLEGAERVAGLLIRGLRSSDYEAAAIWLNGSPAVWIDAGGGRNAAVSVAVEDGRIARLYFIANPHKLARLDTLADLTRT